MRRGVPLARILANLTLAAAAIALALALAEVALRSVVPPSRSYAVLPPGANWTLIPAPDLLHGVEGVSHVRVNRFGVRGRAFGDDRHEYRILAVGGSTTLCRALDDTEVWTHLLEVDLGRTADGRQVWVGNVGRDAMTTRDHVLHIKYLLRQYPRMDVVVALVGANDMISALQQGWRYRVPAPMTTDSAEREQVARSFAVLPGRLQDAVVPGAGHAPWYKRTALWHLARGARLAWRRQRTIAIGGAQDPLEIARQTRASAPKVDSLPSLVAPLTEYRRNLNEMANLTHAAGAELILVTQPSAWREAMSEGEARQLWFGAVSTDEVSGHAFFTTRALARAMARYNDTVLDVCRRRGLACVDAASMLPHDTTALYDDVHFNEQGSRALARGLAAFFRQRAPFLRPT